jgi:hypothetical protein
MSKRELAILEKAFRAEIEYALGNQLLWFMQTKSKLALKLVDEGLLQAVSTTLNRGLPITFKGYALTHAGRIAYCASCESVEEPNHGN